MCEHTVGMHYRQKTGRLPVTEEVRSLPIGAKRPRGRPKKLAGCRVRSPVKAPPPAPTALDVSTENLEVGTVQVPVVQVAAPEPCTSCAEDGAVGLAEAYCAECSDHMCEEHRRAHAKTRVTKNHRVIHVRNLVIEEEQCKFRWCKLRHLNPALPVPRMVQWGWLRPTVQSAVTTCARSTGGLTLRPVSPRTTASSMSGTWLLRRSSCRRCRCRRCGCQWCRCKRCPARRRCRARRCRR